MRLWRAFGAAVGICFATGMYWNRWFMFFLKVYVFSFSISFLIFMNLFPSLGPTLMWICGTSTIGHPAMLVSVIGELQEEDVVIRFLG